MKKLYNAPEFEMISVDAGDIITHSIATGEGDNEVSAPDAWWD